MDSATVSRVNDSLERMRAHVATIEERSQECENATVESARRMDEWAREAVSTDRQHQSLYITAVSELEDARAREQEMERMAKETCGSNAQEEEHYKQERADLRHEVDSLLQTRGVIPTEKRQLLASFESGQQRYRQRKDHVSQAKSRLQSEIDGIREKIGLYQEALGMNIEAVEDCSICFRFRCINKHDPEEEYAVTVVTVRNRFKVLKCDPAVPELDELTQQLMRDENLVVFLRRIRNAFKRCAQS